MPRWLSNAFSSALVTYSRHVNLKMTDLFFQLHKINIFDIDMLHVSAILTGKVAMILLICGINSFTLTEIGMNVSFFRTILQKTVHGGNSYG